MHMMHEPSNCQAMQHERHRAAEEVDWDIVERSLAIEDNASGPEDAGSDEDEGGEAGYCVHEEGWEA